MVAGRDGPGLLVFLKSSSGAMAGPTVSGRGRPSALGARLLRAAPAMYVFMVAEVVAAGAVPPSGGAAAGRSTVCGVGEAASVLSIGIADVGAISALAHSGGAATFAWTASDGPAPAHTAAGVKGRRPSGVGGTGFGSGHGAPDGAAVSALDQGGGAALRTPHGGGSPSALDQGGSAALRTPHGGGSPSALDHGGSAASRAQGGTTLTFSALDQGGGAASRADDGSATLITFDGAASDALATSGRPASEPGGWPPYLAGLVLWLVVMMRPASAAPTPRTGVKPPVGAEAAAEAEAMPTAPTRLDAAAAHVEAPCGAAIKGQVAVVAQVRRLVLVEPPQPR